MAAGAMRATEVLPVKLQCCMLERDGIAMQWSLWIQNVHTFLVPTEISMRFSTYEVTCDVSNGKIKHRRLYYYPNRRPPGGEWFVDVSEKPDKIDPINPALQPTTLESITRFNGLCDYVEPGLKTWQANMQYLHFNLRYREMEVLPSVRHEMQTAWASIRSRQHPILPSEMQRIQRKYNRLLQEHNENKLKWVFMHKQREFELLPLLKAVVEVRAEVDALISQS